MKNMLEVNGKINIESIADKVKMEIKGNTFSIMNLLARLSEELVKGTNLTKEDILFAVNLGLEDKEEIKKTNDKITDELDKLTDQLAEILKMPY